MALNAGSVEATLILDLDDRGFRDGDRLMAEWSHKDAKASLDFKVDESGFNSADRSLHEWGMKSSTAELKFDVDRASLSRLIAGAGGGSKAIDGLAQSAGNAEGGLARFGGTMQGLQWAGILAGAPAAGAALVNLAGNAISVGSALSSLSGLLVAIPQGFTAFAQGAGTVMAATQGIGAALKAYTTQQDSAGKVAQQNAGRQTSAAQAQASAAQQVTGAQQQLADANRQVGDAERNLTVQHEQVTQAQTALNLAVEQAKRDMQDLQRQAVESSTAEKEAGYNLEEARRAYNKALRDPTTSQLHLDELQTGVVAARQAQTDAHIQANRAQQDANRSQREGVQGQPNVVAAHQALTSAIRGEADAHRQLETAIRGVDRAQQNLNYQQKQAKLHIEQQQQSMRTATTTANVYQQALQALTPAQRQFTRFLVDIQDKFEHLRQVAATNLFPGVEKGIASAMALFPRLRRIVADTGQVFGHLAEKIGKFLGSKQFGRDLSLFAHTNLKLFGDLGNAGLHFAHGLEIIMRDAQPFLRWLGRLTERVGEAFNAWVRGEHHAGAFGAFFKETERTLPEVLKIFEHLGKLLTGIGEAAAPIGNKILQFFNRSLKAWADWSHSITGQVELRAFFERLRKPFEDMLKLAAALGKAFLDLFGSTQGQEMLDKLTKALIQMIPPVEKIGETIVEIVSTLGPSLLDLLNSFAKVIADGAPELQIFASALAWMANGLVTVIDAVPGLSQLTGTIAAWGLAMAGVKWVAFNSGLADLATGLYGLVKPGGGLDTAPAKLHGFFDKLVAIPGNLAGVPGRIFKSLKGMFVEVGTRLGLITGEEAAVGTAGGEQAGGFVGKIKSLSSRIWTRASGIFKSIGLRLGLLMGGEAAVGTAGGEAAGAAGGGLIGRLRGLMSKLRGRLGSMFSALGTYLGLKIGEKAAEGTAGGEAAGAAGGGLIGALRNRMPRLTSFMTVTATALGTTFAIAMALAVGSIILAEFDKYVGPKIRSWLDEHIPGFSSIHGSGPLGSFKGPGGVGSSPTPTPGTTTPPDPATASGRAIAQYWLAQAGGDPKEAIQDLQHVPSGPHTPQAIQILRRQIHHGGQRGGLVTDRGIIGFATGGVVGGRLQRPGPTDTVAAMLTPGEIVLPKQASQAIQNAVGPVTGNTEKVTKALLKAISRDVNDAYSGILSDVGDVEDRLQKSNRNTWQQIHKDTDDEIGTRSGQNNTLWGDVSDALTNVGSSWDQTTQKMLDQTQQRFATIAQTAQRQSKNFSGWVQGAMSDAAQATYSGTSYIADAVTKALKAFDSKTKFHLTVDKPQLQQHAKGGMIGGSGRQDTVPLLLGMAAPGEAILTRYQQDWVEAALRNTFGMGLGDLFASETRPHGYAKGGRIPNFQKGGKSEYVYPFPKGTVLGRTDMGVDLGGVGTPFGAIGDAVVTSTYDYFAPSGYPAAGGLLYRLLGGAPKGYTPHSDYIYTYEGVNRRSHTGVGSKLHAGQIFGSIGFQGDDSIEMGWAFPSGQPIAGPTYHEGDVTAAGTSFRQFITDLASGKAISASGGAGSERIGKLNVHGTAGPPLDIVASALGMERGAANRFIADHMPAPVTGKAGIPASLNVPTGPIVQMAREMVTKEWGTSQWSPFNSIEMHEAGYDPHAQNPSSSAYGIAQNISPSTYPPAGRPGSSAPILEQAKAQLEWMVNYIKGRYGNPTNAWAGYFGADLGGPTGYQQGGVIGRLESRLGHLTGIPAIRHLDHRLALLRAKIARQTKRLQGLSAHQLHGARGSALRKTIHGEQATSHQINQHLAQLHKSGHGSADVIQHLQERLAHALIPGFDRAERLAGEGAGVHHLMRRLHVGRGVGSGALRSFANTRIADVRNAMAISRAQTPVLGTRSIFAQGGFLGPGLGLSNVQGSSPAPIYLLFDADVAGFVGRVRAVQDGRETEIARSAGLGRMTPGAIGRKAIYAVPRR